MKTNEIMKKISFFLLGLMVAVFVTSCNKTENVTPQSGTAELSFNIEAGQNPGGLKETHCTSANQSGNYILVTMLKPGASSVTTEKLDVFYINNKPYTNSIKLPVGTYTIREFIMYNDDQTPNDITDDDVIAAGVHIDAPYASLITPASYLDKSFIIEPFKKNTMSIELVCYSEASYSNFGFEYFGLDQTIIREQNFFGDFCIKDVNDYNGTKTPGVTSPYVTVLGGAGNILLDLPAIFKIKAYRNNDLTGTFDNNDASKIYSPLKVTYADRIGIADDFKFELWIMVRVGANYDYVLFHTWTFSDAQAISAGTDGVVDFVLGNCVQSYTDLVLAPWMNLPLTCTYTIGNWQGGPSAPTLGGYVDATLGGFTNNAYDFNNGLYASWCAEHGVSIYVGQQYTMDVYSSLYPEKLPTWAQNAKWAKMNWIFNHLDWYPNHTWSDLQNAMWRFENVGCSGIGLQMYNDAQMYGTDYKVPSGGWACIIFIDHNTPPGAIKPTTQTMFIKVDP